MNKWPTRESLVEHWWNALFAMGHAIDDESARLPWLMRSPTFRTRNAEAALASFVELRRDNILMIENYFGASGCFFPRAFVDPIPELYEELAMAATVLNDILVALSSGKKGTEFRKTFKHVLPHLSLEHWTRTMAILADIARQERTGQMPEGKALEFLRKTISRKTSKGRYYEPEKKRVYDGWYALLFPRRITNSRPFAYNTFQEDDPIVVDIADTQDVRTGDRRYFAGGTGNPGLLIAAIDDGNSNVTIYVGPVSSFYWAEFVNKRPNDKQWRGMVWRDEVSRFKPEWARVYWTRAGKKHEKK